MIYILNLIAAIILLLSTSADERAMIEPEPAPSIVIEYRSPCQEDEGWVTVDHRDPLSTLDGNVSRRCINLDEIAHYLSHQGYGR